MIGKTGIKFSGALALLAMISLSTADAGLKQLEIKGGTSLGGYVLDQGKTGGTDSQFRLDVDLDFKMKFSQDVSARLDLELDNAVAGTNFSAAFGAADRYGLGVDQAYFKMNDFLFRNFSLTLGKQNLNFSLRDNKGFSWGWSDPIAMVGNYSTRDLDVKGYFAKFSDQALGTGSNDTDQELLGVYGEYWLNDDSLVIAYLNHRSNSGTTNENIVHYGVGLDYFIGESLELYGEIAGQSVDRESAGVSTDGNPLQITLGAEYAFADFDMKPTINVEYYSQEGTGTGTNALAWQSIANGSAGAENQSLYVEGTGADSAVRDLNFGAGMVNYGGGAATVSGYNVFRLNGWISPRKSTKIGLGLHMFTDDTAGVAKDDLGLEIDLTASWKYSQDVTFRAGAFSWDHGDTAKDDATGFTVSSSLKF
jgi:hypothetical protein